MDYLKLLIEKVDLLGQFIFPVVETVCSAVSPIALSLSANVLLIVLLFSIIRRISRLESLPSNRDFIKAPKKPKKK